jgi:hypothetical protein
LAATGESGGRQHFKQEHRHEEWLAWGKSVEAELGQRANPKKPWWKIW